jgi:co-chaperonin GroES (HSP10)
MKAVWGRVIIRPDELEETYAGTSIVMAEPDRKKEQYAQTTGELISVGGNAFENWEEPIPKVGDRVVFNKYAGHNFKENDVLHQLVSDTDIEAIDNER